MGEGCARGRQERKGGSSNLGFMWGRRLKSSVHKTGGNVTTCGLNITTCSRVYWPTSRRGDQTPRSDRETINPTSRHGNSTSRRGRGWSKMTSRRQSQRCDVGTSRHHNVATWGRHDITTSRRDREERINSFSKISKC